MKILSASLAALALIACAGRDAKQQDTALAHDLALANQAQTSQPQFRDTSAANVAPRATAHIDNPPRTRGTRRSPAADPVEAPVTQAARASSREIPTGSAFSVASQQRICTSSSRTGDRFAATVLNPIVGSNGAVVPAGSSVVLEVVGMNPAAVAENSAVVLRVVSVDFNGMSYPLSADAATQTAFERTRIMKDPNADKKKVIGGAIAGAIIGQMIGHNTKGTVIGAATGAATGAVVAKAGEQYEACLPLSGVIRVTLNQPLVL